MALQFVKFILNKQEAIYNDDPSVQPQVLCEVLTADGRNEMAFIDVDSLTSCGIAIPSQNMILVVNKEHCRPSPIKNVMVETGQKETAFIDVQNLNSCGIGVPGSSKDDDLDANKSATDKEEFLSKFIWSRSSIKCLMTTYKENEKNFDNGKSTKIQIWNTISKVLNNNGFSVTGEMCQRKWRTHTTTFKNIKEKNLKTGRGRESWEYFNDMEMIFAKDPSYVPLATISCGVKSVRNVDPSLTEPVNDEVLTTGGNSSSDEPTPKRKKKSPKKKVADQLDKISSHMADFNSIFKDLVKAENEKNALLQKLLDK